MFSRPHYFLLCICRYGWILTLPWMASLSQAEIVDRLYEVSVPVADQSAKERHLALMSALDQVLVKASGQPVAALQASTVIQAQRRKAEDYLLEYRYDTVRKEGLVGEESSTELTARFAPETIRQLLSQAGLPLWPRARPTVMVWWQVEEQGQRRLMGDSLRTEAAQRGLPVVLPMNDLQDKLSLEGLWGFEPEVVTQVAERYGLSAVLVGRATGSLASGWRGQWLFYFQGEFMAIPVVEAGLPPPWLEGQALEDLEQAGIEAVIAQLLQRYGIDLAGLTQSVELQVEGVGSFEDYSQVFRYLQGLEPARRVVLLEAEKHRLRYQLEFEGQLAVLKELLLLGGMLVETLPEAEVLATPVESETLHYRFNRRH